MDSTERTFPTASWFENLWNTVIEGAKFSLQAHYKYVQRASAQTSRE